jgi:hypothetical protein
MLPLETLPPEIVLLLTVVIYRKDERKVVSSDPYSGGVSLKSVILFKI